MLQAALAMAGDAIVHAHRGPHIRAAALACHRQYVSGVSADAVLLVNAQVVGRAFAAVALLAFQPRQLYVRRVREEDVFRLARVWMPRPAHGWESRTGR